MIKPTVERMHVESFSGDLSLKFEDVSMGDETLLISERLHNGDWPYYLVIRVIDLRGYINDSEIDGDLYYMSEVCAVSPVAAGKKNLSAALESAGIEGKLTQKQKALELHNYGISALLYCALGNDENELLQDCKNQAEVIKGLFGFYMDQPENRIGNDGWDFIRGKIG